MADIRGAGTFGDPGGLLVFLNRRRQRSTALRNLATGSGDYLWSGSWPVYLFSQLIFYPPEQSRRLAVSTAGGYNGWPVLNSGIAFLHDNRPMFGRYRRHR